jgi:hypothetical protein
MAPGSPGADIVLERLDADTAGQGWVDDGEGGLLSAWLAPAAPVGLIEVKVTILPDAAPRVEVTWIPLPPVERARAVPVVKPAQTAANVRLVARRDVEPERARESSARRAVPVARTDANVIGLASWHRPRGCPN